MGKSNAADVEAIENMLEKLSEAYLARDWDRFTSFFIEDAIWMPPNQHALVGKEAWWSWVGGGWDQSSIKEHDPGTEEIVVAGDWAYEWHNETQCGPGWQRNFKGIFILHRQDSDSWKIARYCFNFSPGDDA